MGIPEIPWSSLSFPEPEKGQGEEAGGSDDGDGHDDYNDIYIYIDIYNSVYTSMYICCYMLKLGNDTCVTMPQMV